MEKYLKALFDLTKLPTKFFFLISIVSGFVLFSDSSFLNEKLFLTKVKTDYGWILGITFILTTGLVTVNFVIWLFNSVSTKLFIKKLKKQFVKKVKNLDPHEKAVIREFILRGQKSVEMPIDDAVVAGLLSNKILVMNKQFGNSSIMRGMNTALSINEYAEELLEFKDVDLSENPTEQEVAKLNRPSWTNKYRIKS